MKLVLLLSSILGILDLTFFYLYLKMEIYYSSRLKILH
jgi:hypothetical protein